MISLIGEAADVVVVKEDQSHGKRRMLPAHMICEEAVPSGSIDAGVSAETLTAVMRHGDFATAMKH